MGHGHQSPTEGDRNCTDTGSKFSSYTCIPHIVVRVGAAVFVKTYPLAMLTLIGGYF